MLFKRQKKEEDVLSEKASNSQESGSTNGRATKRQIGGAATLGCVTGFLLVGPGVALIAAGGAAVAATTETKAGDVARASGDAVAAVGDRLARINQKHHVVDRTSKGLVKGANWMTRKLQSKSDSDTRLP
jgi:hypothetical protein